MEQPRRLGGRRGTHRLQRRIWVGAGWLERRLGSSADCYYLLGFASNTDQYLSNSTKITSNNTQAGAAEVSGWWAVGEHERRLIGGRLEYTTTQAAASGWPEKAALGGGGQTAPCPIVLGQISTW